MVGCVPRGYRSLALRIHVELPETLEASLVLVQRNRSLLVLGTGIRVLTIGNERGWRVVGVLHLVHIEGGGWVVALDVAIVGEGLSVVGLVLRSAVCNELAEGVVVGFAEVLSGLLELCEGCLL